MNKKIGKWLGFILTVTFVTGVLIFATKDGADNRKLPEVSGYEPWDDEIVEIMRALPIQEGGRIKPFETYAGVKMLALHSKRKMKITSDGEKVVLRPTHWMLDAMFRPDLAKRLPTFNIDDSRILVDLGLDAGEKRRDKVSFNYLNEGFDAMIAKQSEFEGREEDLKGLELQVFRTLGSYRLYRGLVGQNEIHRETQVIGEDVIDDEAFKLIILNFLKNRDFILEMKNSQQELVRALEAQKGETMNERLANLPAEQQRELMQFSQMKPSVSDMFSSIQELRRLFRLGQSIGTVMMPSENPEQDEWVDHAQWLADYAVAEETDEDAFNEEAFEQLLEWRKLVLAFENGGQDGLLVALKQYKKKVDDRVLSRNQQGELKEIGFIAGELKYYDRKYFHNAVSWVLMGFLLVMIAFVSPESKWAKWCARACWLVTVLGLGYLITAIFHRGILMQRWPLGNLYETILMITAGAMVVLLFMEVFTKRKICLAVATVLGAVGLFLSIRYESGSAKDTMDPLIAVLRTNYWLTVHVTTITFGYAGGLLTAGLSHVYIFGRLFKIDEGDPSFRRFLNRVTYGGVCFTLLFSLVGTILGGIWANESWGRFWGWDPKENGALMIVLWYLMILHARLGGIIKEWGLHILSIIGAVFVSFSWWGVNFLGTGLHNYGFEDGDGKKIYMLFCSVEATIALVTAIIVGLVQLEKKQKKKLKEEAVSS